MTTSDRLDDESLRGIQTSLISLADDVQTFIISQQNTSEKGGLLWLRKVIEILKTVSIVPSIQSNRKFCTNRILWDSCASKCDELLNIVEAEYSSEKVSTGGFDPFVILRQVSGSAREVSRLLTPVDERKNNPELTGTSFPTDSVIVFDSSSAFFKPRKPSDDEPDRGRSLMSPVLGTEALYRQAGWLTPVNEVINNRDQQPSSSSGQKSSNSTIESESAVGSGQSPRKPGCSPSVDTGASLHTEFGGSNESQLANQATVDEDISDRHSFTKNDGSVTSKAISSNDNKSPDVANDDEDYYDEEEEEHDMRDRVDTSDTGTEDNFPVSFFPIPTSSRDIYNISNRNRRVKKNVSPLLHRVITTAGNRELEELMKAEEILQSQNIADGKPYSCLFDDGSDGQQTGSFREQDDSCQETCSNDFEEDLAFIKELGWIQSEEEISSLLKGDLGENKSSEHSTGTGGADS